MTDRSADDAREGALAAMERHARNVKLTILGAAALEGLMLIAALRVMDWADRTHLLILVLTVLNYTVVLLGLVALGMHVSRTAQRVLRAMEPSA
jgi:hypothetical protein